MPDAFEEQAVLVAAEQAASEGDATAAESHLRTLLELQSARLGPDHPEVASTLHNLAVVCERAGRISDAEGLYRRAFAAASAALAPTDPLVIRCQEDLNAFLEARLMPVQPATASTTPPPARPTPPSWGVRPPRPTSAAARTPARPAARVLPPTRAQASLVPWIAGMAVAAALVAAAAWWATRDAPAPPAAARAANPSPTDRAGASPAKTPASRSAAKATPKTQATLPPATVPEARATPPPEAPSAKAPSSAPAEPASTPAGGARGSVSILTAQLCRELATSGPWTCTPASPPLSPGRLYYFTRVEVPQATAIEHRWYHGDALVQSVTLQVRPNSGAGFRTFSRQTVDTRRAGDWRVEVRAPGGAVLAQERFAVQ
jgi:hypothetical protein